LGAVCASLSTTDSQERLFLFNILDNLRLSPITMLK